MKEPSKSPSLTMSLLSSGMELYGLEVERFKTYLLLIVVAALSLNFFLRSTKRRNLPPGPWGLPVVGYLPFLSTQEPHLQLENFRKKYGNVFGMYLGNKFTLFLGDLATSKEGFNLDEFSGRPDYAFPISENSTHFAALSGQPWKSRRKVTAKGLRVLGSGPLSFEDISRSQINVTLDSLEAEASASPDGEVHVRPILTHATISIILNFVCGKTFPRDHESYKVTDRFLRYFAENGASLSLEVYMPWTRPLRKALSGSRKEAFKLFDEMDDFIRSEIDLHLKNRSETPKDLMDVYLQHYEDGMDKDAYVGAVSGDSQVMIFGGADTVRGSVEWFLLCMSRYPEIQEKVFHEIDDILGSSGDVIYSERHKLPYTEATILESMRFKTLLPLSTYHSSMDDITFHGYDIPKGSLVFSMMWSIHNDPAHWSNPKEFRPEHFLTSHPTAVRVPEAFVPFAPGKRTCPGDKVALMETYMFCVSLIQRFKILPPLDGGNFEGNMRLNMEAQHPVVRFLKRYP